MKRINTIFALAAGIAMFASCDINQTPVWSDDDAFAAFDKTAVSVKEDAGSVRIPVTIASIDPVEVAVTYAAVDTLGAKNGVNFKFTNESGVLSFDGEQRTAYIEVEIIDNPGVFTGDLKFSVDLKGAGDLNLGANKTCVVTITDNDHPLAAILGNYTGSGPDYSGAMATFNINVVKDADDLNVVWFENFDPTFASYSSSTVNRFYGNVSAAKTEIVIPQKQEFKLSAGNGPLVLYGFDAVTSGDAENYTDIKIKVEDGKLTFTNGFGAFDDKYFYSAYDGNLVLTKK